MEKQLAVIEIKVIIQKYIFMKIKNWCLIVLLQLNLKGIIS